MKQSDFVQGMRCIFMHRLRSFLSTLGVCFGVISVIAMLAIGEGSKQEILAQIEQLGTNNVIIRQSELSEEQQNKALEAKSYGLTLEDAHILKKSIPFIQAQAVLKIVKGHVGGVPQEISPEILAVNSSFSDIKGLNLSEGRFLGDLDIMQRRQVCVIGEGIAKKLGRWGHVRQNIRIENLEFQVIGVLSNKNWQEGKTKVLSVRNLNKSIFVPIGIEKGFPSKTFVLGSDNLSEIILQLKDSTQMIASAEAIKRVMEVMHKGIEDYQIIIPQELLDQANQTQKIFNLVLGGIALISMFVGGIGIMNIMLATISERTREIGIRRAIGASQYHIAKQFLIETLILTLSGACLGLIGGVVFSNLIGFFAGWNVIVTGWSIFLAVGTAILVGIASGLYPAIKAASMDPIAALRYV